MPEKFKLCFKFCEILDDAIVDNCDFLVAVNMWVCVNFVRSSMSCPSCVPDTHFARKVVQVKRCVNLVDCARVFLMWILLSLTVASPTES
jgi:hypothetical protein